MFAEALIPTSSPQALSSPAYLLLSDVIHAALRSANNQRDYKFCKILLDVSFHYYTSNSATGTKFLFSSVKGHEVFRSQQYWEMVFLDCYPMERRQQG